ncbi:substrate-binding periplasmic protein [Lacibacterium aquatile]|uniref:Substrate-binding periplasmic protein n=1 Tax=Lacibacterium aquatile TaxID=1168082 RepID=A0ABW5DT01_9PROT
MFVTGPDYQPYVDKLSPEGGVATQILREALATQGRKLQVDFLPWRRGWQLMMEGSYTGAFPYAITPERTQQVLFSDALVMVRSRIYYPLEVDPWWQGAVSATGKSYCRPDGWSDPPAMTLEEASRVTRISAADLAGCLRMLAARRVDFFIGDAAIVDRQWILDPTLPQVRRGGLVTEVPMAVAVSKALGDADRMVALINDGLSALASSGRLEQLRGYP